MRILVAGASGVVGRRLVRLLLARGHGVVALTRDPSRALSLADAGARLVRADAFDPDGLQQAVAATAPDWIVNQLTDLSGGLSPDRLAATLARNARIRTEGTRHLAAAAARHGVRRLLSQSVAWAYADGPAPFSEAAPLDTDATGQRAVTVGGVIALEDATLRTPGVTGTVLRYGRFYGPDTGAADPQPSPTVHVDAAAIAALLAIERSADGVFNIAEPGGTVAIDHATATLGWDPGGRIA